MTEIESTIKPGQSGEQPTSLFNKIMNDFTSGVQIIGDVQDKQIARFKEINEDYKEGEKHYHLP